MLKQMFKIEMELSNYPIKPNHLQVKTYVNMKMVRINQKEKLKTARKMASGFGGMRMVR